MKKFALLMLLFTAFANAQIVDIPDANFKAKLVSANASNTIAKDISGNAIVIDSNDDNEIEVSEALTVYRLDLINSGITNLDGIAAFVNLTYLRCDDNSLTSIDVQPLTNLYELQCASNLLTLLDVSGMLQLHVLNCTNNPTLVSIDASQSNIDSFVSGTFIAPNLTSLNVSGCNLLTTVNVTNAQVTDLNLSNLPSLNSLYWLNSTLSSVDISGSTNLTIIELQDNQLQSLDLTGINNLLSLRVENNLLGTLDVSNCHSLEILRCNNNNLQTLFIKNGISENVSFGQNLNLEFICADESENMAIQTQLDNEGISAAVLNSYCSFTPGGDYNTISGTVRYDIDGDGCDADDIALKFFKINIDDGLTSGSAFTNSGGEFNFYTDAGDFQLSPAFENAPWFIVNPSAPTVDFQTNANLTATQNFCIGANGLHNDAEVAVFPIIPAIPGFDAVYEIVYRNKGNQALTGNIQFIFDETRTDFISANPPENISSAGSLTFDYTSLLPFESRSILIKLHTNSPTDIPAVNIGDLLDFSAVVNPIAADENQEDNVFNYQEEVTGAFDPNSKTCLEGNTVTPAEIGNYLHYAINFENTGNADALNIVVKDTIDIAKFDISSLQVLNASHPVNIKITGNIVEFIFENINLPPSAINPIGGHGNVLFKIKTLPTLHAGDMVSNTANIYFDYNAPIGTNEARTTFTALANKEFTKDESISVYPNPAKDKVKISAKTPIKSVEIYDAAGRILERFAPIGKSAEADLSAKAKGVYFFRIQSENGGEIKKIIKK